MMKPDTGKPAFSNETIDSILTDKIINRSQNNSTAQPESGSRAKAPEKNKEEHAEDACRCTPKKMLPCMVAFILFILASVYFVTRNRNGKKKRRR